MAVSDTLYRRALNRMNITWEPDDKTAENIKAAIEEATAYLRDRAGSSTLELDTEEYRGLVIACAWYFVNNRRAEFAEDYAAELTALRLVEGFGCGKKESVL